MQFILKYTVFVEKMTILRARKLLAESIFLKKSVILYCNIYLSQTVCKRFA